MRCRPNDRDRQRGSVTAEFALVLPAVVMMVVALAAATGFSAAQVGLQEAAAVAAREAARSGDPASARRAGELISGGARFAVRFEGDAVCVEATRKARAPGLRAFELAAESCALRWGR